MLNELFQAFFYNCFARCCYSALGSPQSSQAGKIYMETLPTSELSWQL